MHASLVLTVIGPDRPGLVEALARTLAAHDSNWAESRMAQLAGQFAGILRVEVPAARREALEAALAGLAAEGLHVTVTAAAAETPPPARLLGLALVGQDRPGIVREIAEALARRGVSIEELHTRVVSASMSGETLFEADARLRVPPTLPSHELQTLLEGLANEMMVDLSFTPEAD